MDDDDDDEEEEDEEEDDGEEVQAEVVDEEDLESQARPGVSSVHFQQPAAEDGGDKGKGRMVHPPVAYRSRALSVDSVDEHMHIKVGPAQSPVTCYRAQATGHMLEATCLSPSSCGSASRLSCLTCLNAVVGWAEPAAEGGVALPLVHAAQ